MGQAAGQEYFDFTNTCQVLPLSKSGALHNLNNAFDRAMSLYYEGRHNESLELFESVLSVSNISSDIAASSLYYSGSIYNARGDYVKASKYLHTLVKIPRSSLSAGSLPVLTFGYLTLSSIGRTSAMFKSFGTNSLMGSLYFARCGYSLQPHKVDSVITLAFSLQAAAKGTNYMLSGPWTRELSPGERSLILESMSLIGNDYSKWGSNYISQYFAAKCWAHICLNQYDEAKTGFVTAFGITGNAEYLGYGFAAISDMSEYYRLRRLLPGGFASNQPMFIKSIDDGISFYETKKDIAHFNQNSQNLYQAMIDIRKNGYR